MSRDRVVLATQNRRGSAHTIRQGPECICGPRAFQPQGRQARAATKHSAQTLSTCLIDHVKASAVSREPWLLHPGSPRGKTARLGTLCLCLVAHPPALFNSSLWPLIRNPLFVLLGRSPSASCSPTRRKTTTGLQTSLPRYDLHTFVMHPMTG